MPARKRISPSFRDKHPSIPVILRWADAYHARTGSWPNANSGPIPESPGETWSSLSYALHVGRRCLPGGTTLAELLIEKRGMKCRYHAPPLTIPQILAWADAHRERTGKWPVTTSGPIDMAPGEGWRAIDASLKLGLRGLPGGISLSRLLAQERSARRGKDHLELSAAEILRWADAFHSRHGSWPNPASGPISEVQGLLWRRVDFALKRGRFGLPGGSSLHRLLEAERAASYAKYLAERFVSQPTRSRPGLTIPQILAWADAFHARTGLWPTLGSGHVEEAPTETWDGISRALHIGGRGLPIRGSLGYLLAQERGAPSSARRPMTPAEILCWIDAYHQRHGTWPHTNSGSIPEAAGMAWSAVDRALYYGHRGRSGGSSLARLIKEAYGVGRTIMSTPLTADGILAWADAFRLRTGMWPRMDSGSIPESPGDTWAKVNKALASGLRGLEGGSTLATLLEKERGRRRRQPRPDLAVGSILEWADAFRERSGRWPDRGSGAIPEAPGETWNTVDDALKNGARGLHVRSTISMLLAEGRGRRLRNRPPQLTVQQILAWADKFQAEHGRRPSYNSGAIPESPGETWCSVNGALRAGNRGLLGGLSLSRLLNRDRPRTRPARKPKHGPGSDFRMPQPPGNETGSESHRAAVEGSPQLI